MFRLQLVNQFPPLFHVLLTLLSLSRRVLLSLLEQVPVSGCLTTGSMTGSQVSDEEEREERELHFLLPTTLMLELMVFVVSLLLVQKPGKRMPDARKATQADC